MSRHFLRRHKRWWAFAVYGMCGGRAESSLSSEVAVLEVQVYATTKRPVDSEIAALQG